MPTMRLPASLVFYLHDDVRDDVRDDVGRMATAGSWMFQYSLGALRAV
jgi:hypothetical protein